MDLRPSRSFRLTQPAGRSGISCDAKGAFLEHIPLLQLSDESGTSVWIPRPCDELSQEVSACFGLPIDLRSRAGGLTAIARALNAEDVALAQIATVQLAIPERPRLSKGTSSQQAHEQFIRDLSLSGLLKSDWNPEEHPRWPADSPDSQGGQFAPKGEGLIGDFDTADDDDRASRETTKSSSTSIATGGEGDFGSALFPAVERGEDEDFFDPVVYPGYFHDEVVNELAQRLQIKGCTVETEVIIQMADGSASTRIDLLVKAPNTPVTGVEVKTGEIPP